jgi:hypothetical protein
MTDLYQTILYALKTFKVAIVLDIGEKIIILNPRILETIAIDELAKSIAASDLTDDEIVAAIEVIDKARQPPFPNKKS